MEPALKRPKIPKGAKIGMFCIPYACMFFAADTDEAKVKFCCDQVEGECVFQGNFTLDKDLRDAVNWLTGRSPMQADLLVFSWSHVCALPLAFW